MHHPPQKLTQGWKVHTDAYNDLLDYVIKTRPIPSHGHKETSNGTMPPLLPIQRQLQFTPSIESGENPKLRISRGYIFASYRDTDQSGTAAQLPEVQQWVWEPTMNTSSGGKLTDDPVPTIALTKSALNYIYLELTWTANSYQIGGHSHSGDYAFKVTSDEYVLVKKTFYTLSTAIFKVASPSTTQQPTQETELITHIPAGYIQLDKDGQISESLNSDTNELRWFLQGPIWANRPPNYVTARSDPDRSEPLAPRQPESYTYPHAPNTA